MKITRWGFMSKKQLPLFMVWEEEWEIVNGELQVVFAKVKFNSKDFIGV